MSLSVNLLDIQDIDEAGGTYVAPFYLYLRWADSRLIYKSLHTNEVLNIMDKIPHSLTTMKGYKVKNPVL